MDIRSLIRSLFFTQEHFFSADYYYQCLGDRQTYTGIQQHACRRKSVQCAKEAFRGLQFPSHFLFSLLKTRRPHVAGCHLLCNEGNLLHWHDYGLKVSFHSLTLLIYSDNSIPDHFDNLVDTFGLTPGLTLHSMYSWFTCRGLDMMYPTICSVYSAKWLRAWLPLQGTANAAIHVSLRQSDHHDDATLLLLLLLLFPLHSHCAFPVRS